MDVIVNERFFQSDDRGWIEFYNKHGWVVIKNNLNSQIIKSTILDWENLRKDCAKEMGIPVNEYELENARLNLENEIKRLSKLIENKLN